MQHWGESRQSIVQISGTAEEAMRKQKNDIVGQQSNIYIDRQLTLRSPSRSVEKDEKSRFATTKDYHRE